MNDSFFGKVFTTETFPSTTTPGKVFAVGGKVSWRGAAVWDRDGPGGEGFGGAARRTGGEGFRRGLLRSLLREGFLAPGRPGKVFLVMMLRGRGKFWWRRARIGGKVFAVGC